MRSVYLFLIFFYNYFMMINLKQSSMEYLYRSEGYEKFSGDYLKSQKGEL